MKLYIKLIMTFGLSLLSIILYLRNKSKTRLGLMIAMILSTLGDVFMTDSLHIGDASLYPGAAFFMISHIVYGLTLNKENDGKKINIGTYFGIGIMIVSAIVLEVLAFTVPTTPNTTMALLILIYVAIIGFNLVMNFTLAFNKKGLYYVLPFAIVLFYVTDYWIFLDMLYVTEDLTRLVWYFYPIAQLGLVLFGTKINKVK